MAKYAVSALDDLMEDAEYEDIRAGMAAATFRRERRPPVGEILEVKTKVGEWGGIRSLYYEVTEHDVRRITSSQMFRLRIERHLARMKEGSVPDEKWMAVPPGGPNGRYWSVVGNEGRVVAPWVVEEADARRIALLPELLRALQRADSRLSLLRHRGGIAWGSLGIGDASEYDEVIGQARRLLEQAGTEQAR